MENKEKYKQLLGEKYIDPYNEKDKDKVIQAINHILNLRPNFCPKRKRNSNPYYLTTYCKAQQLILLDETLFVKNYNGLHLYVAYNVKTKIKTILIDRIYSIGTINNKMSSTNLKGILQSCLTTFEKQAIYMRWQKYAHLYINEAQTPIGMFHQINNNHFETYFDVKYDPNKEEMFWKKNTIHLSSQGEVDVHQDNCCTMGFTNCINTLQRLKKNNKLVPKDEIYALIKENTQKKIQKLMELELYSMQKLEELIIKSQ
jgi:hypothetical protein